MRINKSLKYTNSQDTIKGCDEGPHKKPEHKTTEWWYFNVLFNHPETDLKNWSIAFSFNTFPKLDSIKLVIHDNKNNNFGDIYIKKSGTLNKEGPYINLNFLDSYIHGKYPNWRIFIENKKLDENTISAQLQFQATSRPIWVVRNTGRNHTTSKFGYYFIPRCFASGTITINDSTYQVQGLGYHDHTWYLERKKKVYIYGRNVWEWLCVHLKNNWDLFIGKIYNPNRLISTTISPGILYLIPRNEKKIATYLFSLEHCHHHVISSSYNIPDKISIQSLKLANSVLRNSCKGPFYAKLCYETKNIKECLCGNNPYWGQWESTGYVNCEIISFDKTIQSEGWAIMEITKII